MIIIEQVYYIQVEYSKYIESIMFSFIIFIFHYIRNKDIYIFKKRIYKKNTDKTELIKHIFNYFYACLNVS